MSCGEHIWGTTQLPLVRLRPQDPTEYFQLHHDCLLLSSFLLSFHEQFPISFNARQSYIFQVVSQFGVGESVGVYKGHFETICCQGTE